MTQSEYTKIIEWIALNHNNHPSAEAWRGSLIALLKGMVDVPNHQKGADCRVGGCPIDHLKFPSQGIAGISSTYEGRLGYGPIKEISHSNLLIN